MASLADRRMVIRVLIFVLLASGLASAQVSMPYMTRNGTGDFEEKTITLTPGTFLSVGNGALQVQSAADFKAALGLPVSYFSGNYADLSGTPLYARGISDWSAPTTLALSYDNGWDILDVPSFRSALGLAAVATSGAYSDLTGTPTTWPWSAITATPTTLAGYGITGGEIIGSTTGIYIETLGESVDALYGYSEDANGVTGQSGAVNGSGIHGANSAGGAGVFGSSNTGTGVYGYSQSLYGVYGASGTAEGLRAATSTGAKIATFFTSVEKASINANGTLTLLGNTLTLAGNAALSGTNTGDQDLSGYATRAGNNAFTGNNTLSTGILDLWTSKWRLWGSDYGFSVYRRDTAATPLLINLDGTINAESATGTSPWSLANVGTLDARFAKLAGGNTISGNNTFTGNVTFSGNVTTTFHAVNIGTSDYGWTYNPAAGGQLEMRFPGGTAAFYQTGSPAIPYMYFPGKIQAEYLAGNVEGVTITAAGLTGVIPVQTMHSSLISPLYDWWGTIDASGSVGITWQATGPLSVSEPTPALATYFPTVFISDGGTDEINRIEGRYKTEAGFSAVSHPSASASLDFPSIAGGGSASLTLTVSGVVTNNTPTVSLGWSAALPVGIVVSHAWVSAANTVTVTISNITGSAIDPAAVTCRASVTQY